MKLNIKDLIIKKDSRGWLAELIKSQDIGNNKFGQLLVTTANPGQIKGNHFHKRKREWYCLIRGNALLILQDNVTGEKLEMKLDDKNLKLIEIPVNVTHAIYNNGKKEMYLLAYVDEVFNSEDPDTYFLKIF